MTDNTNDPQTTVITNELQTAIDANVAAALAEDVRSGDVSAQLILADQIAQATVITREAGVFCGRSWVEQTLTQVARMLGGPTVDIVWHTEDGNQVGPNDVLFELSGTAQILLTAERTMLNFVQLLSGTATKTAHFVNLLGDSKTQLLDTRKTIPGLRLAQKYAVTCGGGVNHRMGLYDAYLLKENHIAAAGSITAAVRNARQANPELSVEVEVETIEQLKESIAAGADIAMVDNFSLATTRDAVALAAGKIKLEASGGIDEKSITEVAATGVDYISMGALTKHLVSLDLSMRFNRK